MHTVANTVVAVVAAAVVVDAVAVAVVAAFAIVARQLIKTILVCFLLAVLGVTAVLLVPVGWLFLASFFFKTCIDYWINPQQQQQQWRQQ